MKQWKRAVSYLLITALLFGLIPVSFVRGYTVCAAETPQGSTSGTLEGTDIRWELTEDTAAEWDLAQGRPYQLSLIGSGEMPALDGPEFYGWHTYRPYITTLSVSEGITNISQYAFTNLVSMKTVLLPESIEAIGDSAFEGCTQIADLTIPNRVASIGSMSFAGWLSLKTITFGTGLKTIGQRAFYPGFGDTNQIEELNFNEGLLTIGAEAFERCTNLTTLNFPDSLVTIGSRAFADTMPGGILRIPQNVSEIGEEAFCSRFYTSIQEIQVAEQNTNFRVIDHVLYQTGQDGLPERALVYVAGCQASELQIADGTKVIDRSAFISSLFLTSVILPDSLQSLNGNTFSYCMRLTNLTIGKGLKDISGTDFEFSERLENIVVDPENPYIEAVDNVIYAKDRSKLYLYPAGKRDTSYTVLPETKRIDYSAIVNVDSLQQLYLPESVNGIHGFGIYFNQALREIYFAGDAPILENVHSLESNHEKMLIYRTKGSEGWDYGTWITFDPREFAEWDPNHVGTLEGSFDGISWLYDQSNGKLSFTGTGEIPDFDEYLTAPWIGYMDRIQTVYADGVTEIGANAFADAQTLLLLETDENLRSVGDGAFRGCVKLWALDIASAEVIGAGAFENNASVSELTLETIASISAGAFSNCSSLKSVFLGSHLTVLEENVFSGCTALSDFLIPESISQIKSRAFYGCKALASINIPANVSAIGAGAFASDEKLQKVYFYGEVPADWADDSFSDCGDGLTLYYRKANTGWDALAGGWNGMLVVGLDRFYTERKDHYSFDNSAASFGYSGNYQIPRQRYVDVLDSIVKGTYYFVISGRWQGSCFGMAASTLSFYENPTEYNVKDYDASAENLFALGAPRSASAPLTKLIEACQISQYQSAIAACDGDIARHMNDLRGLIRRVEAFERSGGISIDENAQPVIMVLSSANSGHAVIPVSVDQADNGDFLLKVYDPNVPGGLSTLKIKKDLSGIEYGPYSKVSYLDYLTYADDMSGVVLHENHVDSSVYISVDSEKVNLTNDAGVGVEDIEGAYEQFPVSGTADDTFSGIRSFVLPEGNYRISPDHTADGGSVSETGSQEEHAVTFYMASEDIFAEVTSDDRDAALTVNSASDDAGTLTIAVSSDSSLDQPTVVTVMNGEGMERTIEAAGDVALKLGTDSKIIIEAEQTDSITIDGQAASVEDGQIVSSFVAKDDDLSIKIRDFVADASCNEKNELSGTINADLISNSNDAREVTVKAEFFDESSQRVTAATRQMLLKPGRNFFSWTLEELGASFGIREGEAVLSCKLTVTDASGKAYGAETNGIVVTVTDTQGPNPPDTENPGSDPNPTESEPTESTSPTEPDPTEPKPTEPDPTEPKPTEPDPTEPKPTDPADPNPTEPEPTESTSPTDPADPNPTEPKPTDPADPNPTEPKPTDPANPNPTDSDLSGDDLSLKVSSIRITAKSNKVIAGNQLSLKAEVLPASAVNKGVIWKCDQTKYATVSKTGVVTAKKAGAGKTVTVTATAKDGSAIRGTYKIRIGKAAVTKIRLTVKKKTLKAGKKLAIQSVVTANSPAANKKLKWTSSNKKYATVSKKGVVTAKKAGAGKTVTITAKATDGSKKSVKIRIKIRE